MRRRRLGATGPSAGVGRPADCAPPLPPPLFPSSFKFLIPPPPQPPPHLGRTENETPLSPPPPPPYLPFPPALPALTPCLPNPHLLRCSSRRPKIRITRTGSGCGLRGPPSVIMIGRIMIYRMRRDGGVQTARGVPQRPSLLSQRRWGWEEEFVAGHSSGPVRLCFCVRGGRGGSGGRSACERLDVVVGGANSGRAHRGGE